jgi:hypothetical protein
VPYKAQKDTFKNTLDNVISRGGYFGLVDTTQPNEVIILTKDKKKGRISGTFRFKCYRTADNKTILKDSLDITEGFFELPTQYLE